MHHTDKHVKLQSGGNCLVCNHYGEDCTGQEPRTAKDRARGVAEQKLAHHANLQTAFWKGLGELEELLGVEIDSTGDLMEATLGTLVAVRRVRRPGDVCLAGNLARGGKCGQADCVCAGQGVL